MKTLEVLFTPADFGALVQRELRNTVCVVFDVLRATSTMVTALAHGAAAVLPVAGIPEALEARGLNPNALLAGERDGVRIRAALSGSIDFDLGNSPREFTAETVAGRAIIMTTTNGTRALRACAAAPLVLAGSFLNLRATAEYVKRAAPVELLLVCSGTHEQAAYEDVLAAGALCDLLWPGCPDGVAADSAQIAVRLFQMERKDLKGALGQSRNGRRLLANPELREDIEICARLDSLPTVVRMRREDGTMRQVDSTR